MSRDEEWDDEPEDDDEEGDLTTCPECGTEVYEDAEACPSCGHWFLPEDRAIMRNHTRRRGESERSPVGGMIVKIVVVLLVIVFVMVMFM